VLIFISHLATPEGKPHEEGGRVTIRQFRGSRAIGFWSHFMFGLERNQQAEDETERRTTILRCLKDRVTGKGTGKTLPLVYDQETGLLSEGDALPGEFRDETQGKDF
jgi:twinkle protein